MSSVDIDKVNMQEIVDTLSVVVLQLRDENAKMNSTLTALRAQQNPASQTSINVKSDNGLVKQPTTISASGEIWTPH